MKRLLESRAEDYAVSVSELINLPATFILKQKRSVISLFREVRLFLPPFSLGLKKLLTHLAQLSPSLNLFSSNKGLEPKTGVSSVVC